VVNQPARVNHPEVVRREYATEERFLTSRLSTWAELDGRVSLPFRATYRHSVIVGTRRSSRKRDRVPAARH
jgi:hypothetical protein